MLLTPEELHELTDCARKGDQIEWLRARSWVFEVGITGRPKVDSEEYERHMIGGQRKPHKKGPDTSWYGSSQKTQP
jgi:uncharacterized protein DUF4224